MHPEPRKPQGGLGHPVRVARPLGRRYFLVTEAGRITSPRGVLPTQRARDSYEVLDTTSNKFSLAAFYL